MPRISWIAAIAVTVGTMTVQAQHEHGAASTGAPSAMTDAQKIANAKSAAPPEIANRAAIMDWPGKPDDPPRQLVAGTNGWTCFPNSPTEYKGKVADDPMCLDAAWQKWADAWQAKKAPEPMFGIAYMLKGDKGGSNTDPFATAPTADNQWVVNGPHVMVLLPDPKQLDAYSSDPKSGGPYVMFKGTPYAHLMVPVGPKSGAPMMHHTMMAPPKPKPKP